MDAGVLPVKRFDQAKQRLAGHFDAADRTELARALFDDALALLAAADFLRWWVVSDDPSILDDARTAGHRAVADPGGGLNPALIAVTSAALAAGAESVTVVPSDVPLAFAGDLQDVLDTGATSEIVVVPSGRGGGTNALYLRPPDLIEPQFGEASFRAHIDLAESRGLRCSILSLPRLALDIDTIEDVDQFMARPKFAASQTAALLERVRAAAPD